MEYRNIFIVILIVLIFAAGYFFYKDIELDPQNAIISYIEQEANYQIDYSSVKLWPLNELRVENLTVTGEQFILKVPKLNLSYSFFDYFKKDSQITKLIKNINLDNPEFIYNQKNSSPSNQITFSEIKDSIFRETEQLYIKINNGSITVKQDLNNIRFDSLNSEIEISSSEANIKFKIKEGLKSKGILFDQYQLENYSTDNFVISAELKNQSWDLYLKNDDIEISQFETLITEQIKEQTTDYVIENINGNLSLTLNLKGQNENIESYESSVELAETEFDLRSTEDKFKENIKMDQAFLYLNSKQNKVFIDKSEITVNRTDYNFKGFYDLENNSYSGDLESKNFQLADNFINKFLKDEIPVDFKAEGTIDINIDGNLDDVNLISELELNNLKIREHQFKDVSAQLRYLNNTFYIDDLKFKTINDGIVDMKGFYSLNKDKYHAEIDFYDIYILTYSNEKLFKEFLEQYKMEDYLKGKSDFSITTTGSTDYKNNTARADFNFHPDSDNKLSEEGIKEISGQLLYEESKIFVKNSNIKINDDILNIFGHYNLKDEQIYAKLKGENINLSILDNYLDFEIDQQNEVSIEALIEGPIDKPLIKGELSSYKLSYQDYNIKDLKLNFSYYNKVFSLDELKLIFDDTDFNGNGKINITDFSEINDSELELTLTSETIDYKKIEKYYGAGLPIKGDFEPSVKISGYLDDFKIRGDIYSSNTEFMIEDNIYKFDEVAFEFGWSSEDNLIVLREGIIKKEDFNIILTGQYIDKNLEFDFKANNLNISELNLLENVSGIFNFEGSVSGSIDNPIIDLSFKSNNFSYQRFTSDKFSGKIDFNDDTIKLKDTRLLKNNSVYDIEGKIENLSENRKLKLNINTAESSVKEVLAIFDYSTSYNVNYSFRGNTKITGNLSNPSAKIDIAVFDEYKDILKINGIVNEKIDLALEADEVPLDIIEFSALETNYKGNLSFTGDIKGNFDKFVIDLETKIEQLKLLDLQFNNVLGNLKLDSSGNLNFNQSLIQNERQKINLAGKLNLNEQQISNITLKADNYNIGDLSKLNESINKLEGNIDGEVNLSGNIDNPILTGDMSFQIPVLAIDGISDINNLDGQMNFNEKQISLKDVNGNFGEGSFKITGAVNYLDKNNFWNLKLFGNDFYLDRGSFTGSYDPDIEITSELDKPLISGDLKVHDFIVNSELNWPTSENENGYGFFRPQLKLNLLPGENVYFRNHNIDIQVEGGNLQLNYLEEELAFLGKLTSNQGSLDYYNNKFIVENVSATFEMYRDNIPVIHLVGTTLRGGTKIYIYVDGPADNLNISFGSEPELKQDQIIALLTKRGGLSGFTSEGEINPGSMIGNELFRYIGEQIQLNFIQKIERNLAETFKLDRFEIDTYSLANEREVTVYLGKDITDKLYIEYTGTFSPEIRDSELSFKYDINRYLNFEGGWYGEDDYRFLLEADIDF